MRPTFRNLGQKSAGDCVGRMPLTPANILSGSIASGDLPRASAIATRTN